MDVASSDDTPALRALADAGLAHTVTRHGPVALIGGDDPVGAAAYLRRR